MIIVNSTLFIPSIKESDEIVFIKTTIHKDYVFQWYKINQQLVVVYKHQNASDYVSEIVKEINETSIFLDNLIKKYNGFKC